MIYEARWTTQSNLPTSLRNSKGRLALAEDIVAADAFLPIVAARLPSAERQRIAGNFNSMRVHGPRAVVLNERRVCPPKKLAVPLGLLPGEFAYVRLSPVHDGELLISVCHSPAADFRARDHRRPRQLTASAQISLPSALLDHVGVTKEEPWVYFAATEDGYGLRVIPAVRVEAHLSPRPRAQVVT